MPRRRTPRVGKRLPSKPAAVASVKVPRAPTVSPVLDDAVKRAKAVARGLGAVGGSSVVQPHPRPRRPSIPSAEELFSVQQPGSSSPYEDVVLGGNSGVDLNPFDVLADTLEEGRARRADVQRTVSPAPTSNPPRPRALEYTYDPARAVLTVTYRDGGTYEYSDVPRRTFYNMTRVKSTGKFINRNIKGFYPYTKIGA